jgi:peptidyl-prolyl cis-trans isomerase B (cyclophilin B)
MIPRPIRPIALLAVLAVASACTAVPGGAAPTASPAPSAASSGECPAEQPAALPAGETRTVTLDTTKGPIAIKVEADLSPIAAGNFVALAECGFYDGVVFHRTATLEDGTPFVIQGGDPDGTGGGGPGYTIEDEPVTATYGRGTVAMARTADPDSVGSQFFIVLDDGARDVLAAYNTYQIIGAVTEGMENADAIYQAAGGKELPAQPESMTSVSVRNP